MSTYQFTTAEVNFTLLPIYLAHAAMFLESTVLTGKHVHVSYLSFQSYPLSLMNECGQEILALSSILMGSDVQRRQ